MSRFFLIAALTLSAPLAALAADPGAPQGDAARGHKLFVSAGCYQCHGFTGETGGPGPRLDPQPLPYDAVMSQLRKPVSRMPIYTAKVMPDQDVADIYAYMRSQPKPKALADIPLLK
jgi:ubiquinol-cytochrome c reductase cytochrome c subunit